MITVIISDEDMLYILDYFLMGLFWIYFNDKFLSWKIISIDSLEVFPGLLRCCVGAVINNAWKFQAVDCCLRELHLRCCEGSKSSTVLLAVNDVKSLMRQRRTPIQTLIDGFLSFNMFIRFLALRGKLLFKWIGLIIFQSRSVFIHKDLFWYLYLLVLSSGA